MAAAGQRTDDEAVPLCDRGPAASQRSKCSLIWPAAAIVAVLSVTLLCGLGIGLLTTGEPSHLFGVKLEAQSGFLVFGRKFPENEPEKKEAHRHRLRFEAPRPRSAVRPVKCAFSKGRFRWGCGKDGPPAPAKAGKRPFPIAGVNAGGWLCLEDWFFSGEAGSEVMTSNQIGQGVCLPPEIPESKPWPSEGMLVKQLNRSEGPEKTVRAFAAHRDTFIRDDDFRDIAELGIKKVRVPLTWTAFADALRPISEEIYGSFDPDQDSVVVPDPYYFEEIAHVTIPRDFLVKMLYIANHHGVQLHFDIHNLPGGSSHGTYNGIYPLEPVFWSQAARVGDGSVRLQRAGLLIAEAMVRWVEGLDGPLRGAVAGLTFMNEPAHLNAVPDHWLVHDEEILQWLASSANLFRNSSLPEQGVLLYVNVQETAFHNYGCAFVEGAGCGFDSKVPKWWAEQFSAGERNKWAVIDLHRYDAFTSGQCDGRVAEGGAYACSDPIPVMERVWYDTNPMRSCAAAWAKSFLAAFPYSLRAASEFSGGTYWNPHDACTDRKAVGAFISAQAQIMNENYIEPFFWTWRMPNGNNFETGWSLKWITGRETGERYPCRAANFTVTV